MEENEKNLPQSSEEEQAATIPSPEPTVAVKFNKEIKNLPVSEAAVLAQKGLKFDMISGDFERMRRLANSNGQSVGEYLSTLEDKRITDRKEALTQKCGGDQELAEHIIKLENSKAEDLGLGELTAFFPELTELSALPPEVVEKSQLCGSRLLDEFLRYRLVQERARQDARKAGKAAAFSSVGSQSKSESGITNTALPEFLKGLWGR